MGGGGAPRVLGCPPKGAFGRQFVDKGAGPWECVGALRSTGTKGAQLAFPHTRDPKKAGGVSTMCVPLLLNASMALTVLAVVTSFTFIPRCEIGRMLTLPHPRGCVPLRLNEYARWAAATGGGLCSHV